MESAKETELGEERLVLWAQSGDHRAFDLLLRRYERPLFRHVHRMLGDEQLAYEALQETYLVVVRNIHKLRSRTSFRPWTYGVATRVCLKILSKRARRREVLDVGIEAPDRHALPDSLASSREELELVMDQVLLLSPKVRSVILLHFVEGMTLKEVAAALEISIGTVKSRLGAGLAVLRQQPDGARP